MPTKPTQWREYNWRICFSWMSQSLPFIGDCYSDLLDCLPSIFYGGVKGLWVSFKFLFSLENDPKDPSQGSPCSLFYTDWPSLNWQGDGKIAGECASSWLSESFSFIGMKRVIILNCLFSIFYWCVQRLSVSFKYVSPFKRRQKPCMVRWCVVFFQINQKNSRTGFFYWRSTDLDSLAAAQSELPSEETLNPWEKSSTLEEI